MTDCTKPNISELLVKYLSPEEFPEDRRQIEEHLRDCPECREELEMLRKLHDSMKEHRAELADAVSPCPSDAAIAAFVLGETSDLSIERHAEYCAQCRTAIELARAVSREETAPGEEERLTAEERILISNTVKSEYGGQQPKKRASIFDRAWNLFQTFHIPSLAVGAVAAALLLILLMPHTPEQSPLKVVLSDVIWDAAGREMTKSGDIFEQLHRPAKKVTTIILLAKGSDIAPKEIEEIYRKADLAAAAGPQYEVISPGDLKKAFGSAPATVRNARSVADLIFGKIDADYCLIFEIEGSGETETLRGTLFEKSRQKALAGMSRSNLVKGRIPEGIIGMGKELLMLKQRF